MKSAGISKPLCSLVLIVTVFAGLSLGAQSAHALCVTPEEEGEWVATTQNSVLEALNIEFICQDVIRNGEPYPPGPPFYMHPWGSCYPSACDWDEHGADRENNGYILSVIDQGFVTRWVWARMSAYYDDLLYVWIWSDFDNPKRKDYSNAAYFERVD